MTEISSRLNVEGPDADGDYELTLSDNGCDGDPLPHCHFITTAGAMALIDALNPLLRSQLAAAEARAVQAEQENRTLRMTSPMTEMTENALAAALNRVVRLQRERDAYDAKLVAIADLVNHFHNGIRDVEAETVLGRIADVLGPPLEGAASGSQADREIGLTVASMLTSRYPIDEPDTVETAMSHPAIGKSSLATPELGSATLSASSSAVGPVHRVPNMGQDTYRPSATPAPRKKNDDALTRTGGAGRTSRSATRILHPERLLTMGWSIGYDDYWKRDIGYGVPAYCDHPNCTETIDRGLSYVCGGDALGGEHGCGLYFCGAHLAYTEGEMPQRCDQCINSLPPFAAKPDHPSWMRHQLTDESWATWRAEHPGDVARMTKVVNAGATASEKGATESAQSISSAGDALTDVPAGQAPRLYTRAEVLALGVDETELDQLPETP